MAKEQTNSEQKKGNTHWSPFRAPDLVGGCRHHGKAALRSKSSIVSKDSLSTWGISPNRLGKQTTLVSMGDLVRMLIMTETRTMVPVQGGVGNAKADVPVQVRLPIWPVSIGLIRWKDTAHRTQFEFFNLPFEQCCLFVRLDRRCVSWL